MNKKLISLQRAVEITHRLKRQGKKISFTNGCFDILHAGHVMYLEQARRSGDILVLGLNSDESVRIIKGPGRPVNCEKDRAQVLAALSCIDYIVIFDEPTPLKVILALRPNILVKGSDWKVSEIAGAKDVLNWGGKVKRISLLKGRSTTRILNKIKGQKAKVKKAL
ncbi:MAG: hypothetical protein A3G33_00800 [Omnitrophica bacterium RIFCSPLOWO2_12_FULL_44_17]|uniref:D-glycero-beta-D-manno-heptose 1-phosphate adenylyltransferase n=1 Tax=Candidatus Danuiimicrobium aquiferis TaxID=1801832 RepID=A0A1G1L3H2_9BACT|nr:MAG: hypothetical protein A3B72_06280 [Omnitrophica bacterium RIFCSPHIGHO2_02_FULL_45_28]OGW89776.1 MAG: hypothetical protein A3E74_07410 [Omnitrophica bacterium RIFCSPHIGHO2_12_FULL_44_12]OGW99419.1 MAG: hypothetical protein A3G33_00800 [Omnitrophica bacterium RIFCSPLOWO2_12_FULL_44_17]OGX03031.1 MAG: hypothetical protein A3J12_04785 [Omnitrophica bacterium RIFCSPLOWO2_02_FULL_44_11]